MVLTIVSKDPDQFIRKSSSKHDEYIRKTCVALESSQEKFSYKNLRIPLLVKKPWGEETLIGLCSELEIWELVIQPHQQTSYHCHPNKDTLLLVVSGTAQLRTESKNEILESGNFRLIEKKAFHQLICRGDHPLILIEIESPSDKNDLVRIEDAYQRKGKAYLHKSKIVQRERLTEIVLLDKLKTIEYLERQDNPENIEHLLPIHITTNLGMTRELYTPKSILKQFGDVSLGFAAGLEIFVPSLDEIEKVKKMSTKNS